MSQSGFTPISIYYSTTASAVPTAANLVPGELAINTADGKLYYEDSSGVVQVLATKSTGSIGGSNTQVQFNNSGSLGGSSSFTWDGTTVTATKFAGALNGTVGATTASTGAFTTLSATGVATFSAGTVSLPAITTTGDTNTGIFFPAADTIAFTEGGTESMRVSSAGNLLVGYTSDQAIGKLQVNGTGRISSFDFGNNGAADISWVAGGTFTIGTFFGSATAFKTSNTERMRISDTGLVGIGTTSPTVILHTKTAGGEGLRIQGTATSAFIRFTDASDVSTAFIGQNTVFDINNQANTAMRFSTNNSARMTLTAAGLLGIGTTSPSSLLHVKSSGSGTVALFGDSEANNTLAITRTVSNESYMAIAASSFAGTITAGIQLILNTSTNTGGSVVERVRLDSGGNLLIGKTSATANGGDLQVSSGITFPATQVAKSDANTLDDYEEGTWTPALGSGVTTYATRNGIYTKIGRQVTVFFDIAVTTTTATGNMEIIGLPFAQASGSPIATGSFLPDGLDLPANTVSLSIVGTSGGSSTLRPFAASDNGGLSQVQYETGVAFTLYGAITYIV